MCCDTRFGEVDHCNPQIDLPFSVFFVPTSSMSSHRLWSGKNLQCRKHTAQRRQGADRTAFCMVVMRHLLEDLITITFFQESGTVFSCLISLEMSFIFVFVSSSRSFKPSALIPCLSPAFFLLKQSIEVCISSIVNTGMCSFSGLVTVVVEMTPRILSTT